VKLAVTVVSLCSVTSQAPVPEQPPPDQPVNVEPESAVAVSVTCVPAPNELEQVEPQLMPAGLLATVPEPLPDLLTLNVWVTGGIVAKVAVTAASALIVTEHTPVPEQPPPDQPEKLDPDAGVAVRWTTVPWGYCCWQLAEQLSEAPSDTDPEPVPANATESVRFGGGGGPDASNVTPSASY
jgi:hypothetical protein